MFLRRNYLPCSYPNAIENAIVLSLTSVIAPATVLDVVAVKPFISKVPVTYVLEEINKDPPVIFVLVELNVVFKPLLTKLPAAVSDTFAKTALAVSCDSLLAKLFSLTKLLFSFTLCVLKVSLSATFAILPLPSILFIIYVIFIR